MALAENIGFAAHELSEMTRVVGDNQDEIERAPYQTLITSMLHKYVTGRLRDHSAS